MRNAMFIGWSILTLAAVAAVALLGYSPESIFSGYAAMAAVQTAYGESMARGFPGMLASSHDYAAETRLCETAAGIGFGLACGQGTGDKGAVLGASAATGFVGVSIKDITLVESTADEYQQYKNMAVLTKGDIWVTVAAAVSAGQNVTFNTTTGALSTIAADGSNFTIAGARWMTTAGSGELAMLRLGSASQGAA